MITTWLVGLVMLVVGYLIGYAAARQGVHIKWPHGLEVHTATLSDASAIIDKLNAAAADAMQKQVMVSGILDKENVAQLSKKIAEQVKTAAYSKTRPQ